MKKTSLKLDPPLIWRIGRISTPGASIGTRNAVSPRCRAWAGSLRAISSPKAACRAPDVHTFCPLSTQSLPRLSARSDSEARSLPAPGSEKSWHTNSSAASSRGISSRCWAGVPNAAMVGATRSRVTENSSFFRGTSKRASSRPNASS